MWGSESLRSMSLSLEDLPARSDGGAQVVGKHSILIGRLWRRDGSGYIQEHSYSNQSQPCILQEHGHSQQPVVSPKGQQMNCGTLQKQELTQHFYRRAARVKEHYVTPCAQPATHPHIISSCTIKPQENFYYRSTVRLGHSLQLIFLLDGIRI